MARITVCQKKSFFVLLAIGTVLLIGLSAAARAAEAGHALIVLKGDMAAVSPDPLKVNQGTTIIQVNECKEPVSIIIKTKVGIACKNPVNFLCGFIWTL
jgi:hypothetical protein